MTEISLFPSFVCSKKGGRCNNKMGGTYGATWKSPLQVGVTRYLPPPRGLTTGILWFTVPVTTQIKSKKKIAHTYQLLK